MLVMTRTRRRPARARRARAALLSLAALAAAAVSLPAPASAACPWIVQPHAGGALETAALQSRGPTFDIMFDGLSQEAGALYAFSVASIDLAWQLAGQSALPDLDQHGRRLEPVEAKVGATVYRIAPDTIDPHTIYLVTARRPVPKLERIGARIEPARPLAVAHRTRGASDVSGPLPHFSMPGFEIAAAAPSSETSVQICAYQVALR